MKCDCHNDAALLLREHKSLLHIPEAQFDFARAKDVLDVAFCAIWIDERKYGDAQTAEFEKILQLLNQDMAQLPDVQPLLWQEQLDELQKGTLLSLISMEGAGPLAGKAENILPYFQQGLRAIGLTWNFDNAFAGAAMCGDEQGLSEEGRKLVQLCNQQGILLDAAHAGSATLRDLLQTSQQPIIDSHTVCRALSPEVCRGLTDAELVSLAEKQGVAGICFVQDFLGGEGNLECLCRHIEHAVGLIGSEHVALGGDLDGCEPHAELAGVQHYAGIYRRLRERGMNEEDVHNVSGESVRRLLKKVLPHQPNMLD